MRNPRLAGVYAKSLLDFAQNTNQVVNVFQDMQYVKAVINASPEFTRLLSSPIIKDEKKSSVVGAILKDNISAASWAFITLVIQKNRARYLDQIAQSFIEQYEAANGIHEVLLTTAIAVDNTTKDLIVNKLKGVTQFEKVRLNSKVNPDIIGGFILEFDNKLIDASVSRKLNDLKLRFTGSSYVAAV
ncbi:MAG: ATP synthase F1 subunit delta [Pseudopedobacter saltans]|uniref:ATP synthase subunit delta n=1 Tax=Pseudopedobacter saltans TaxID=151895 RepID=A0A2W5GXS2_9SPHI|nr:MAG: ATP synthase F1 subunit delta [Pseudopedobacter saltans]